MKSQEQEVFKCMEHFVVSFLHCSRIPFDIWTPLWHCCIACLSSTCMRGQDRIVSDKGTALRKETDTGTCLPLIRTPAVRQEIPVSSHAAAWGQKAFCLKSRADLVKRVFNCPWLTRIWKQARFICISFRVSFSFLFLERSKLFGLLSRSTFY